MTLPVTLPVRSPVTLPVTLPVRLPSKAEAVTIPATFAWDPPITVNLFGSFSLTSLASSIALDSAAGPPDLMLLPRHQMGHFFASRMLQSFRGASHFF